MATTAGTWTWDATHEGWIFTKTNDSTVIAVLKGGTAVQDSNAINSTNITVASETTTVDNVTTTTYTFTIAANVNLGDVNLTKVIDGDTNAVKLAATTTTPANDGSAFFRKKSDSATTAEYVQAKKGYYTVENNAATWHDATSDTVLATITNLKAGQINSDNLTVNGSEITVKKEALDGKDVTLTNSAGQSFTLATDANASSTSPAWSIKDATLVYAATTTAGYAVEDNTTIKYTAASPENALVTIAFTDDVTSNVLDHESGTYVENTFSVVSISGTTVTLNSYSDKIKTVTISDDASTAGYAFDNQAKVSLSNVNLSVTSGTATVTATQNTGYLTTDKVATAQEVKPGVVIAEVTGLATGDDAENAVTLSGTVITVGKDALTTSAETKAVLTTDYGYTLALGSDVTKTLTPNQTEWRAVDNDNTKAAYTKFDNAYYSINGTNTEISYTAEANKVVLATITGLTEDAVKEDGTITGVSITKGTEDGKTKYTFKLTDKSVIGANDVSVTTTDTTNTVVALEIDASVTDEDKAIPTDDDQVKTWAQKTDAEDTNKGGKTYTYTITTPAHYANVTEGTGAGTTVKYTAETTDTTVTIAGLKLEGLTLDSGNIKNGDTVVGTIAAGTGNDAGKTVVTLKKDVLNEEGVTLTSSEQTSTYILKLDSSSGNGIPTISTATQDWVVDESDSTKYNYVSTTPAYYAESSGGNITYTVEDKKIWVSISGNAFDTTKTANVTVSTSNAGTDENATTTYTVSVADAALKSGVEEGDKIEIEAGDLTGNVAYDLVFGDSIATSRPNESRAWVAGETAGTYIYRGTTAAYYEKDTTTNRTFTYHKLQPADLMTISGLKAEAATLTTLNGLTVDTITNSEGKVTGYKVTLPSTVLATPPEGAAISFENGSDRDEASLTNKMIISGVVTQPTTTEAWTYDTDAGTAQYQKITSGYYSINYDTGTYTYVAEAKDDIISITGLKTEDISADTDYSNNITLNSGVVTLNAKVLDTAKTVTLLKGDGYTLALDTTSTVPANKVATVGLDTSTDFTLYYTGSASTGIIYVKGKTTAGYVLNDDATTVTYKGAEDVTVAQISGLKQGTADLAEAQVGIVNTAGSEAVQLKTGSLGADTVTFETVGDYADNAKVKAYKLALVDVNTDTTDTEDKWVISGSNSKTASYQTWFKDAWTLSEDKMSVEYTEGTLKETVLTVSGLSSAAVVQGGKLGVMQITRSGNEGSYTYSDPTFVEGITHITPLDSTKGSVTFKDQIDTYDSSTGNASKVGVLDTSTVRIEEGADKYTIATVAALQTAVDNTTPSTELTQADTTVTYKVKYTAGFAQNDTKDTLTHYDAGLKSVVTITGIKTGAIDATTPANNKITVAEVAGTTTFKLADDAFNGTDIVLTATDGKTYALAKADGATTVISDTAPAATLAWKERTGAAGTYDYISTVGAYYTYDSANKKYIYHAAVPTTLATITGLKGSLTVEGGSLKSGEPAVAVVTVDSNNIKLKAGALDGKAVTLTNGTAADGTAQIFVLANDDSDNIHAPQDKDLNSTNAKWYAVDDDNNSAQYKLEVTSGYNTTDNTKWTYTASTTKVLATLTGPADITVSEGAITGVAVDTSNKKVTLDNQILPKTDEDDGKQMTLTLGTTDSVYAFKLDVDAGTSTNQVTKGKPDAVLAWDDSKKAESIYSYVSTVGAHYTVTEDKVVTYKKAVPTTLLTVTGLKANLTADEATLKSSEVVATLSDKVLTVKKDALPTTDGATVSITAGTGYTLQLDESEITAKTVTVSAWTTPEWIEDGKDVAATKGIFNYARTRSAGYEVSTDKQTITKRAAVACTDTAGILASITGLKTGASAENITVTNIVDSKTGTVTGKKITLPSEVLTTNDAYLTTETDADYQIVLASDVLTKAESRKAWEVIAAGVATFNNMASAYYTAYENGNGVTYNRPVNNGIYFTISGLKTNLATQTDAVGTSTIVDKTTGKLAVKATYTADSSVTSGMKDIKVTVYNSALNSAPVAKVSGLDFEFVLGDDVTTSTKSSEAWTAAGTDSKLVATYSNGYLVGSDGSIKYYTSTDSKNTENLVVVSGLATGTGTADNISNEGTVITVKAAALGTSNVTVDSSSGYTLKLEDNYTYNDSSAWAYSTDTDSTGKLEFKSTAAAHFVQSDDKYTLKYVGPVDNGTFIEITGLKSGLTTTAKDNKLLDNNGNVLVTFDEKNKTILLSKAILPDSGTVQITKSLGDYAGWRLAFNEEDGGYSKGDIAKVAETGSWTVRDTTATYSAAINAGYKLSDDGKSITKENESSSTLAVVTGVKNNLANPDDHLTVSTVDGVKYIALDNDALDTTTVKIAASYGYKLKLADGVNTSNVDTVNELRFDSSGDSTTATYKTYKPQYYTVNASNELSITCTKEAVKATLATVTGLKKATEGTDEQKATAQKAIQDQVKVDKDDNTIVLGAAALDDGNTVTLNSTKYKLKLAKDVTGFTNVTVPAQDATEFVKASGETTAYFKAGYSAGYVLDANDKKVTYSSAKTSTGGTGGTDNRDILATIKGLKSTAAANTLDYKANNNTVIVESGALDQKNVTISGNYGIKLVTANDVPNSAIAYDGWDVADGATTAIYRSGSKYEYYYQDSKGNLVYGKPVDGKAVITITGLKAGTAYQYKDANNNELFGTRTGTGTAESPYIYTQAVSMTYTDGAYHVTLSSGVLPNAKDGATIKLTKNSGANTSDTYILDVTAAAPTAGTVTPTVTGTTLKLTATISAGYERTNNTTYTYRTAKTGSVLATVTGLKSTASVAAADIVDGKIYLDPNDLATSKVTIKNATGQSYALALTEAVNQKSDKVDYKWYVSGNTATYRKITAAYYSIDSNGAIIYHAEKLGDVMATVKGVSSNLMESRDDLGNSILVTKTASGEVAKGTKAISISGLGEITLTKQAVIGKNITLTNGKGNNYTLGITTGVTGEDATKLNVTELATTNTWTFSGTTATLKAKVDTAGYKVADDKLTVLYTNQDKDLFSIKGLKKGIVVDTDGKIKTAAGGTEVVSISGTTVTIKADALTTTNVTITDKNYSLSLDDDVTQSAEEQSAWVTKGTTAVYKVTCPAYYEYDSSKNTVYYRKATNGATMLTLSGNAFNGWSATETIHEGGLEGVMIDTTNNKVILSASVLKPTSGEDKVESGNKVTLSGTSTKDDVGNDAYSSYTLDFDIDVTQSVLSGTKEWRQAANSTSATYVDEYREGYKLSSNGKTINYANAGTTTLYATLNGLKKNATARTLGSAQGITVDEANTITFNNIFLGTYASDKVTLKNVTGAADQYKLSLDSDDTTIPTDSETITAWSTNSTGTTAYLKEFTPAYYTCNDTTVTRYNQKAGKTLATITGLNGASALQGKDGVASLSGITTYEKTVTDDDGNESIVTAIVLDETVLPAKGTAANNGRQVKVSGTDYILELGKDSEGTTLAAPKNTAKSWAFKQNSNSISATLTAGVSAGYVVSDDAKTITTTTQSAGSSVVTVSGINKDYTSATSATSFAGIAADGTGKTITLTKDMLGTSNVTVNNKEYKLELDSEVATEAEESTYWSVSSNTSTSTLYFKKGNSKYYTYDENKNTVTYHQPTKETQQFSISGLASGLKVFEDNNGESTFGTIETDQNGNVTNKTSLVTLVEGSDGITYVTLKNDALPDNPKNGAKITLTTSGKYQFALDEDVDLAEQDSTTWTVSGTTATLTAHVPAGYILTNGKTLTYSAEKTGKTAIVLATITGIDSSVNAKDVEDILNVNTDFDNNTITLPDAVLGTANVTLKNGTGQKFKLEVGTDVATKAEDIIGWNKSGTNAVYQSYKTAFYTEKSSTSINYTKATAALTWLTLTGLKSDFAITDGKGATTSDYGNIAGVEINDEDKTVTLTASSALSASPADNAKVTVKGTNDTRKIFAEGTIAYANYKLKLSDESDEAAYDDTFTVMPTTNKATYTTSLGNGYIVAADGKSLTYTAGKTNQTVVTITGLNLNFTATDAEITAKINSAADEDPARTLTTAEAKAEVIKAKQETAINEYVSIGDNEITLKAGILGTSNISLTQGKNPNGTATAYKLVLDTDVLTAKPTDWTESWTVSGTTATFKKSHDAYYVLNAAGTGVTYNKPSNETTLMTIKGLKSGLTVEDGVINGINVDGKTVTLNEDALGTSDVTLTNGSGQSYKLAISGVDESAVEDTEWVVSNGTAVYKTYNKGYYKLNGNKVTYGKPGAASLTYVTITGLAKTVTADDMASAVSGNTITLTKDMLTTSGVTVKQGKDSDGNPTTYALALSDATGTNAIPKAVENVAGEWKISGTTATYVTYNKGFYTESNGNITYTKDTTPVTLMTIKGLKSGLTVSDLNAGIGISSNTVTLSQSVLGTSAVTLTQGTTAAGAATTYELALKAANETNGVTQSVTPTYEWAYSGTTATYKQTNTAYYELGKSKATNTYDTITYRAAGTTTLATIAGIKSGLLTTTTDDKITVIDGITIGSEVNDAGYKTITLAADALTTTNVKLTNGTAAKYVLATANGVATTAASEASPEWVVSGTTATYRTAIPTYYTTGAASAAGNTITAKADSKPVNLFTISGLAKDGATAAQFATANTTNFVKEEGKRKITIPTEAIGSTNISVSVTAAGKANAYQFDKFTLAGLSEPGTGGTYKWGSSSKNVSYAANTAGFVVNGLTATYYKADAKVAATIKVDRDNLNLSSVTPSENVFTLSQTILGTNKSVTVTGEYGFNFSNFSNAAITGSAAGDTVIAATGNSLTISGGNGNDSIESNYATVSGDTADTAFNKKNFLYGGAGNDTLKVTSSGYNVVYGDAGTDTIIINSTGNNTVNGGADSDLITIQGGTNLVYGGAGNDDITISGGTNKIYGDAGNDTIRASADMSVTIYGGADNDSIAVTSANTQNNNIVYGDAGNDTIDFAGTGENNTINGGAGNDVITVTGKAKEVYGGDGNDTINANGSGASIFGGAGVDIINIASSNNTILGGAGNDFFVYTSDVSGTGNVIADFGTGTNRLVIAKEGTVAVRTDDDDLVVKLGSSDIVTLKDRGKGLKSGAKFSYYTSTESKATATEVAIDINGSSGDLASSADLIYDDAHFTTNDLTDLVNHSVDTHSINGLNPTQDLNDLDQSGLLTYGKDDKENK